MKRVMVLEDEALLRLVLHEALECHFEVASVEKWNLARDLVAAQREQDPFDVVVLDMHLKGDQRTGAGIGLLVKQKWPTWSPELLIFSSHSLPEYYQLALNLGVAAYLDKSRHDVPSVIRHVRALTLRRGLSVERPAALAEIKRIAESSRDRGEAVRSFCRGVLSRELAAALGSRFLILLTDPTGTYGIGSQLSLPEGIHRAYAAVQALTHGRSGSSEPFVLVPGELRSLDHSVENEILERLDHGAFIPLAATEEIKLSLGVLPDGASVGEAADARALAHVLLEYFSPAVLKHFLTLTATLAESDAKRLAVLKATSHFCLYVGQEQLATLAAAGDAGELIETGTYCEKLQLLATDLRDAGEVLGELAKPRPASESSQEGAPHATETVAMNAVIAAAWHEITAALDEPENLLQLEGECRVRGRRDNLQVAAARVLQWLVQRMTESPADAEPAIFVRCQEAGGESVVSFEDRSRRLSDQLREYLFVPFSQTAFVQRPAKKELRGPGIYLSLYMAKMLVELGGGGVLEDRSAELPGERGHRLTMRFPRARAAAA